MSEPSNEVLAERITTLTSNISALTASINQMNAALAQIPVMARDIAHISALQEEHAQDVNQLSDRVSTVEQAMPGLLELRRWVIAGILGALAMLGAAVVKLSITDQSSMAKVVSQAVVTAVQQLPKESK